MRRRLVQARALGVSLRRFDGWEPRQFTVVTAWTAGGFPAAWTTTTEPEWDGRERSLMLALAYYEAGLCRRCGEHLAHSTDPLTDPDRDEATRQWIADAPEECFSCKVLVRSERRWEKDAPDIAPWLIHSSSLIAKKPRLRRKKQRIT